MVTYDFAVTAIYFIKSEFLCLETGVILLKDIISIRRLMCLQNILKKSPDEIVRKVYEEKKINPIKGDWTELVQMIWRRLSWL